MVNNNVQQNSIKTDPSRIQKVLHNNSGLTKIQMGSCTILSGELGC